ncbi:MAG: hypothetical protein Q4G59_00680 [Planctomycetia bacterium]|nr:hypothetical protein [Planctomycetia bacterium]
MTIFDANWPDFWATAFHMSWCEIGMLLCFGASWPSSIHKMLQTGSSAGKSRLFLVLVLIGYLFGVAHKLFYHLDVVVLLYLFLFFVVLIDLAICQRLRRTKQP